MTDVAIYQTNDGGEISVINGTAKTNPGIANDFYLSMFGGNENDGGGSDMSQSWWANAIESDPEKQVRARTQNFLRSMAATTSNLKILKEKVLTDIAHITDPEVTGVTITIPRLNWVSIVISTQTGTLEFIAAWEGQ